MEFEYELSRQIFNPFSQVGMRDIRAVETSLFQPCGRFKSPLRLEDRLRERLSATFRKLSVIDEYTLMNAGSTPLPWQILLSYLQQKNISTRSEFSKITFRNDLPKQIALRLEVPNGAGYSDGAEVRRISVSIGDTIDETMSKTVGELLERHFTAVYRDRELRTATYEELADTNYDVLNVSLLNTYRPNQSRYRSGLQKTPLRWIRGTNLSTGAHAYIPAQLVFWNYIRDHSIKEPALAETTTSGSAGHFTKEEATLNSLLEAIQRDGFFIYWLNSLSPKRINVEAIPDPAVSELLVYLRRYRIRAHFLNTSSDIGVPSITCALLDDSGSEPMLAIGGATGFTLGDMILHSAREAISIFTQTAIAAPFELKEPYTPFTDHTIKRKERLSLWRGEKMFDRFKFFISGELQDPETFMNKIPSPNSVSEQLAYVVRQITALGKGYEIYAHEIRHEVLDTLGYHVVRTVIPKLFPLYLTESMATLDSERLRNVPQKLGFQGAAELNPWPHPFP